MSFTTELSNKVLDRVFGSVDVSIPNPLYVALATNVTNADGGTFNEMPQLNGYDRTTISSVIGASGWHSALLGSISNSGTITFPKAVGGDWSQAVYFVLCSGTIAQVGLGAGAYAYGSLTTPKTISNGDTAKFSPSSLSIFLT